MTDSPSLLITPARASFVIALATIAGLFWTSTNYLVRQDHRIAAVEAYIAEQKTTNRELLAELKTLTVSVARLSTVMETMTRQTKAAADTSFDPGGVVEAWSGEAPHRSPSSVRDGLNLAISGAPE